MKCCIWGAGSTGGHLAVKLALAGQDVSVLARGAQLDAIRENGLVLLHGEQELRARPKASSSASDLGVQDLVFLATKATALHGLAGQMAPLVGPATRVVFLQNGMTWWYPLGLPPGLPPVPDIPFFSLAAGFLQTMTPDQLLGGIVYSANELLQPGVIRNNSPGKNGIEVAAIAGASEAAVNSVRAALEAAGLASPAISDIRSSLWLKLVGNCSASSLCIATGNPAAIVSDPAVQTTFVRLVAECLAVAKAHGFDVGNRMDIRRWTQHRAQHKPSMLQDFNAGRPMEIAEMILAPLAFARAARLHTPTLDAVAAIAVRLAVDKGLFSIAGSLQAIS